MVLNVSVGASGVASTMSPYGHQAQLDQRLEAVADAQHQAIAGLEQVADRLGDLGSAEERRDELGGAVGLVAAREAAGDHDDLACTDAAGKLVGALGDGLGREVVDHEDVGLGAGARKARAYRTRSWCPGTRG